MKRWEGIVLAAARQGATDLHLEEGQIIHIRCEEGLVPLDGDNGPILCNGQLWEAFPELEGHLSYDMGFSIESIRIRAHFFQAGGKRCATLRLLLHKNLALGDDEESQLLKSLSEKTEGLLLLVGPTGSGKSFTLAACIEYINTHYQKHIVTLEDPVEFLFTNKLSLIHQRQLGVDVESMTQGIKDALRQDPDIIMVGELRDRITLEAALHAAETGHLVLATMHTQRAVMAINRMISLFPAAQQEEVRSQISQVLQAIICQRLVRIDKQFVILRDILLNTPAVANLIRLRKEPQIVSIQETQRPMKTLEMAIEEARAIWGERVIWPS